MGVPIKDIARKLGVSTTTVSLVLNNKPSRISPETRQAVLQAAAELNYHPNQIAVSMVTRRTGTIGLLLPDISNLYFSSLAKVIESECSALGYNVLYGNTNDSVENDFKYLELFLLGRAVDAVCSGSGLYACAATGEGGCALLAANYCSEDTEAAIELRGWHTGNAEVRLIDEEHTFDRLLTLKGGECMTLSIPLKNHSVVYIGPEIT